MKELNVLMDKHCRRAYLRIQEWNIFIQILSNLRNPSETLKLLDGASCLRH